ncbi:peptidylprolyl isomerase [Helicobacter burdigaliensis]|uniref:peptidylprolyl isomerase n=1 Tax=Helicobacter burdigaliensis TaxID=2315334 RepID=UPI000EF65FF6|nr:peptidylprolyl isomerase [Helicobacter burdigaliensis]
MIGWMQKHRKYLVITIWVSTIALVGASVVGWGVYSFSSASNSVAKVGDTKISIQKMQQEYSRLYNLYNQITGGGLDEEQAQKLGIQEQAINNLIYKTLMLNYARDLGLLVQKEEIIQELSKMQDFYVNGKFSKEVYLKTLEENNLKAKDFEESIYESLLLQKLGVLLDIPLTPLEIDMLRNAYFTEDRVSIKILDEKQIEFNPKEEEIKKYWEENKDIYQTQRGYELEIITLMPQDVKYTQEALEKYYNDFKNQFLDAQGQIIPFKDAKEQVQKAYQDSQAQKEALKQYIALRKAKEPMGEVVKIYEKEEDYKKYDNLINLLSQAKEGDTLKPTLTPQGYVSAKIKKIIPSVPKAYEEAKKDASMDYIKMQKNKMLEKMAQEQIANFANIQSKDIGFVGRDYSKEIAGLSLDETQEFISKLFMASKKEDYILLENKAILYAIKEQRSKNSDIISKNLDFLIQSGTKIKQQLVEGELLNELSKIYKITKYQ